MCKNDAFDEQVLKNYKSLSSYESVTSALEEFDLKGNLDFPCVFREALQQFSDITDNSSTEQCLKFMNFLKDISNEAWEILEKFKKETAITDFYHHFRKLRDLVRGKLSLPLDLWKRTKKDAIHFSEEYAKLLQELDDARHAVEKARLLRDKVMPQQAKTGEEEKKSISASEDFKSLHPFFVIANSEEQMEFLKLFNEKKLKTLQEQQEIAEQKFKNSTVKFRKETEYIIQETIKTNSFIEWLEEKNHSKMKEYEASIKEQWDKFSQEMEESRNLGKIYREKHAIYLDIKREEDDKALLVKQITAAILLQYHWRRYIKKKSTKEDI